MVWASILISFFFFFFFFWPRYSVTCCSSAAFPAVCFSLKLHSLWLPPDINTEDGWTATCFSERHIFSRQNGCSNLLPAFVGVDNVRGRMTGPWWSGGIGGKAALYKKWPKPVCCRGSAFIAGSGSFIRSSIACKRKPTTSMEWPTLPVSSPRWRQTGVHPIRAPWHQDPPSQVPPGGCCSWEVREAGRPQCAQSCCGPRRPMEHTGACTSIVWLSTSAGRMTRTRCVSAGLSEVLWLRSAAAA